MSYTKPVFAHGDNCLQIESAETQAASTDPATLGQTQVLLPGDYELWVTVTNSLGRARLELVKRNAADSADVWVAQAGVGTSQTLQLYFPRVSVTNEEFFRARWTPAQAGALGHVTFSYRQLTDRTRGEPDYFGGSV